MGIDENFRIKDIRVKLPREMPSESIAEILGNVSFLAERPPLELLPEFRVSKINCSTGYREIKVDFKNEDIDYWILDFAGVVNETGVEDLVNVGIEYYSGVEGNERIRGLKELRLAKYRVPLDEAEL